jgi:hypothetical protein
MWEDRRLRDADEADIQQLVNSGLEAAELVNAHETPTSKGVQHQGQPNGEETRTETLYAGAGD